MSTSTALLTLSRRRLALSAHTPREIVVPLVTPVLFAVVIAPALGTVLGSLRGGLDYMTFVALATVGLLVPINTMFSGIGVIVDRQGGAQRELLTAPIRRQLVVLGNLVVAVLLTGLQIGVLVGAAALRGAKFQVDAGGMAWFIGAVALLTIGMYGVAEIMANRAPSQESYVGALPAIAIVPWFFAGSLFPITTLPSGLSAIAKVLPLTHALALIRYGLLDKRGTGLHDIWGMSNTTEMAALSLGVVALFAVVMTALAIRIFTRSALQ
ncbi:MAG TPA: ABC transporter permease [Chloroflexota bacterium]